MILNLLIALIVPLVSSKPIFPAHIPNAARVTLNGEPWGPVGHLSKADPNAGNLNPFGQDVRASFAGGLPDWAAVCDLDSDGDGVTNGFELGDENCVWRSPADDGELRTTNITHPGFDDVDIPPLPGVSTKVKLHAAFMTAAWLLFAPIGVLTAVFLKVKVESKPKNVDWFKIHQVCMGTTVYLTLVAYVLMVRDREAFLLNRAHTRLGHAVIILAIIQPLSGIWRIHIRKDGSKSTIRLAWEFFHQWLGRSILILACVTIFLGYHIATFFSEELRITMKIVTIAILLLGAALYIFGVFTRKDERRKTPLPVKKDTKPVKKESTVSEATTATQKTQSTTATAQSQQPKATTQTTAAPKTTTTTATGTKPATTATAGTPGKLEADPPKPATEVAKK